MQHLHLETVFLEESFLVCNPTTAKITRGRSPVETRFHLRPCGGWQHHRGEKDRRRDRDSTKFNILTHIITSAYSWRTDSSSIPHKSLRGRDRIDRSVAHDAGGHLSRPGLDHMQKEFAQKVTTDIDSPQKTS